MRHAREDYQRVQDPAAEPEIYRWVGMLAEAFREHGNFRTASVQGQMALGEALDACPVTGEDLRRFASRAETAGSPIGKDEPVFLIRGRDLAAPGAIRAWADLARLAGASPFIVNLARGHALAVETWQSEAGGGKVPDIPARQQKFSAEIGDLMEALKASLERPAPAKPKTAGVVVLAVPEGTFCDECGAPFTPNDPSWTADLDVGLQHSCPDSLAR